MKHIFLVFAVFMIVPLAGMSQTLKEINKPIIEGLDQAAPFSEGLAAVRKGTQWGFIDKTGKLVIDFRNDLVWNKEAIANQKDIKGIHYPYFKEGRCIIQELKEEDIPYYGFIDTNGGVIIEPNYLNVTQFDDGRAIGIYCKKTFRGKNNFQLNIYDYSFTEVVLNTKGEIIWPIAERENIQMSKKRYQTPEIRAKLISEDLLSVKNKNNNWVISKLELAPK